jgi:diguanylate cyclase (GGDEF)-like protein
MQNACMPPLARQLPALVLLFAAAVAGAEPQRPLPADADAAALRDLAQQAALLEQAGQGPQALRLLRELARRTDEVRRAERERLAATLRERFASERQSQQLERLRLEAERQAAERGTQAAAQRLTVAVGVAALLACAVLAQWLLLSRRRLRALRSARAALQERSARDPLTGLFNRGHAQQRLDALQAEPPPDGSLLMLLDVDHFKRINDSHGHAAGDAVLQALARRLEALVRDGDLVARWGGEEFLLLLRPGNGDTAVLAFAERALRCVASQPVDAGLAQPLAVSMSAGITRWPAWPGQTWAEALARADEALYRAKGEGRNRAVHAQVDGAGAVAAWPQVAGPVPGSGGSGA